MAEHDPLKPHDPETKGKIHIIVPPFFLHNDITSHQCIRETVEKLKSLASMA